jgi:hypothetical protein
MYIVERKIMTTLEELNACGRSDGPDYVLNFDTFINAAGINGILNDTDYNNTNISELLNILIFTCYPRAKGTSPPAEIFIPSREGGSVNDPSAAGNYDYNTNMYAAGGGGAVGIFGADPYEAPLYSLADLDSTVNPSAKPYKIPVSLLKRIGAEVATGSADANSAVGVKGVKVADKYTINDNPKYKKFLVTLLLNMAKILDKTRTILGPGGWTNLFQKVKGGGGSSKKHTHRRHRRRYSSKQY